MKNTKLISAFIIAINIVIALLTLFAVLNLVFTAQNTYANLTIPRYHGSEVSYAAVAMSTAVGLLGSVVLVTYVYVAVHIRRLLRDASQGKLFTHKNGKGLRNLGIVLIILPFVTTLLTMPSVYIPINDALGFAAIPGALISFLANMPTLLQFNFSTLLLGMLMITIGELIKEGKEMQLDLEYTV